MKKGDSGTVPELPTPELPEEKRNVTYILLCGDGTLYTGWTNDLGKRLDSHNRGTGSRYTKTRLPVQLVYYETLETKQEAMRREWQIKQLTRAAKLELIRKEKVCREKTERTDIDTP